MIIGLQRRSLVGSILLSLTVSLFVACQSGEIKSVNKTKLKPRTVVASTYPRSQENQNIKSSFNARTELANSTPIAASKPSRIQNIEMSEKEKAFFELAGENITTLTEIGAYRKVIEKYQINDAIALKAYSNILIKKFPRSIYCDNALYLMGMMYFTENKYGESLNAFQKILTQYPQSNKAVSALFAKGIVFKKMHLNKEAMTILSQVSKLYPGSPESMRAEMEMKLISQNELQSTNKGQKLQE